MDYYNTYYPTSDPGFYRDQATKLRDKLNQQYYSVALDELLEETAKILDYLAEETESCRYDRYGEDT